MPLVALDHRTKFTLFKRMKKTPCEAETQISMNLACFNMLSEYCENLDTWRGADNLQYFTPDGTWMVYDGRSSQPVIDLRGGPQLASWFAKRDADESRRTRHFIGNMFCSARGPRTARLRCMALVFHLSADQDHQNFELRSLVEYRDELTRGNDGRWRFSARVTTVLAGEL